MLLKAITLNIVTLKDVMARVIAMGKGRSGISGFCVMGQFIEGVGLNGLIPPATSTTNRYVSGERNA